MNFSELNISPEALKVLLQKGIVTPTAIQEKSIPVIQQGKDVVGHAVTGSGKTLAFTIPVIEHIKSNGGLQVLVLAPTRELCVQISDVFRMFAPVKKLKVTAVYGGVGIEPQISALKTTDVLVATPGRLLDLMERRAVNYTALHYLILDEVDKMFEMGFIDDVEKIIRALPKKRQTLLFSATFNGKVNDIVHKHQQHPVIIKTETVVDRSKLKQHYYVVDDKQKFSLLHHFIKHKTEGLALVFCGTRQYADIVTKNLQLLGIKAMAIHGGLSQNQRLHALESLKKEHIDVLVATDVAARGLDIKNVSNVYNYDAPKTSEEYIHRIGRTARAGASGIAISLISSRDFENFRRVLEDRSLKVERVDIPPFETVRFNTRAGAEKKSFGGRQGHQQSGQRDSGSRGPTNRTGRSSFGGQGDRNTSSRSHSRSGHSHQSGGFGGRGRS